MKTRSAPLIALLCVTLVSCSSKDSSNSTENVLGGDPNVPLGAVGNQISVMEGGIYIGDAWAPVAASMTLVKNENGVATFHVEADLTQIPALANFNAVIPASAKDASGKVVTDVRFKITSEGIQDYFDRDGAPFTMVKYDAAVGDEYKLTKASGVTVKRTVVERTDQDDFPYGTMNIKTIAVEHESHIPGIKKFIYRANHKFGIVYFEADADDGSCVSMVLSPSSN